MAPVDRKIALVVDDDVLARLIATDILQNEGFRTLEAENTVEALDVLDKNQDVSVLITDIRMPGDMDGLALSRKVSETHPHVAILILSGFRPPEATNMPTRARFLAKPYSAYSLITALTLLRSGST